MVNCHGISFTYVTNRCQDNCRHIVMELADEHLEVEIEIRLHVSSVHITNTYFLHNLNLISNMVLVTLYSL